MITLSTLKRTGLLQILNGLKADYDLLPLDGNPDNNHPDNLIFLWEDEKPFLHLSDLIADLISIQFDHIDYLDLDISYESSKELKEIINQIITLKDIERIELIRERERLTIDHFTKETKTSQ